MKRVVFALLFVIFCHLAFGLYAGLWDPKVAPPIIMPGAVSSPYLTYGGAINVHSTQSSGSGTIEEIALPAEKAGLDFLIMTDSHDYEPKFTAEGYYNKVLLMVGGEYSFLDSRLLIFDMRSTEHLQGPGRSQMNFADILSRENHDRDEGMFVLAHPLKPGFRLTGELPVGLDGVEIFNLKSIWQWTWLKSKASFFWSLFIYPFNPNLSFIRMLEGATDAELSYWDELLRKQTIYGFAGSDAEAKVRIGDSGSLVFPSYETLFSIVRNNVLLRSELTGNYIQDKRKIADALRDGRFYMSVDILQDSKGFYAAVSSSEEKDYLPGERIPQQKDLTLKIHLPVRPLYPFRVNLLKDGQKLLQSESVDTEFRIFEPGIYRVEIYMKVSLPLPDGRKWLPWIITNPFFVEAAN